VIVSLKMRDYLLPVGGKDVLICAMESLVNLRANQYIGEILIGNIHTFAHAPV